MVTVQPVQPVPPVPSVQPVQPHQTRLRSSPFFFFDVRLSLDPEGRLKWRGAGSFRKAFYKRISLKMNRHKKFKICEFDFNFILEIPLKMKTSKIEKSPSILYENPCKNESEQNSKSRSIFI